MSTVDDVYAALRDSPDRGIAFEKLMVRYFGLHPTLRQEYDQVCRWTDWEYNGGRPDTGVDLVAHRREDDSWTAVQCKNYESTTTLSKGDLDSFFTASGQGFDTPDGHRYFTNRIIISTTDRWGRNAEAAIEDQAVPVQRFGLAEIAEAPIDWDIAYPGSGAPVVVDMRERQRFALRPHQREAVDKVLAGFRTHDRGQLIMACGTGKTFTALRLAEEWAENNGGRARVLFCVPSLSLLAQSMREWTTHAELDLRCFAVCSDTKVTRAAEDIATYDLEIPVTTDGATLAERLRTRRRAAGLSVVFATYQSLQAVHGAQELGADDFDLVLCDEAHRTTGVTLAGEDPGQFVRVHDPEYIRARHRLYMTATPRLYDDEVKGAAAEHSAELASMDDEAVFGPEFHRLGFGTAVESGLLTDYRVLVLTVDQELAAAATQDLVEDDGTEIRLDDVARLIGCWNGLAGGFDAAARPMQRAVAFAVDIRASRRVAETFPRITAGKEPEVDARHVDGTMNALERGRLLQWLKAPVPDGECRVLTNARCLSEGVDVPALDAVMFLNPRSSTVDVVQSVGRVMRRSPDKDYGYIILPVGVPAGTSPAEALKDNRRFRVVWQVLNALRAHDERFNAVVNSVALEGREALQDTLRVDHLGEVAGGDDTDADAARQLALFSVEQWREAVYTRVVEKVGDRAYWEDWSADVADIASAQVTRIREILATAGPGLRARFDDFLAGLRANLNDAVTEDEAVSMLSQHLITAPVFDALFGDSDFARRNPVSRVMDGMVRALDDRRLESETEGLARFYESVRARASAVTSASGKQQVVKDLYERFFRTGFPRQADKLGIVYTPVEVVDFILRAADHVLREHFGRGLTDRNVHVQDPFTGTGTFIVRLLQSGLIRPEDLERTYREELWATEIMLLAYYVAAVNIEVTYNGLQAERARRAGLPEPGYAEFPGIVLGGHLPDVRGGGRAGPRRVRDELRARAAAARGADRGRRRQPAVLVGAAVRERLQREHPVPDARRAHPGHVRQAVGGGEQEQSLRLLRPGGPVGDGPDRGPRRRRLRVQRQLDRRRLLRRDAPVPRRGLLPGVRVQPAGEHAGGRGSPEEGEGERLRAGLAGHRRRPRGGQGPGAHRGVRDPLPRHRGLPQPRGEARARRRGGRGDAGVDPDRAGRVRGLDLPARRPLPRLAGARGEPGGTGDRMGLRAVLPRPHDREGRAVHRVLGGGAA